MKQQLVKIGEGGRLVVPADFRKELGIQIGDELSLHLEEGKIVIMTRRQAVQYVQEQMSSYAAPNRSLSEELLAERREEAKDD